MSFSFFFDQLVFVSLVHCDPRNRNWDWDERARMDERPNCSSRRESTDKSAMAWAIGQRIYLDFGDILAMSLRPMLA